LGHSGKYFLPTLSRQLAEGSPSVHRIATIGAPPSSARQASRARVLAALRVGGAMSRADLVAATGLARSTVATVVAALQDSGAVVEIDRTAPATGRSGRRPVLLQLHGGPGAAVGVELTNGALRVVACDLAQRPLAFQTWPLDPGTDPATALRTASALIDEVLEAAGVDRAQVIGAGVTLPGPIRRRSGIVGRACTLPPWIGVRARDLASSLLGLPVLVDNDANLAALAEVTWGAGRGLSDVAYVYTATGIGTGVVLDGRVYAGASGTAGEIGHTTLDDDGRVCACGNRGCLNTVADADAIVRELRHRYGDDLTIDDVIAQAQAGDVACQRVLADAGRHIGVAIANLYNLLDPELIVLGGNLGRAGEILLGPLRDSMARRAIQTGEELPPVVVGELDDRVVVLGAAAAVLRDSTNFPLRSSAVG
jgi:predicted NBD/HSP70 family sugar kinase